MIRSPLALASLSLAVVAASLGLHSRMLSHKRLAAAVRWLVAAPAATGRGARGCASPSAAPACAAEARGRQHRVKIDSSPQQAASTGPPAARPTPRRTGSPATRRITIKVPRGQVKIRRRARGVQAGRADAGRQQEPDAVLHARARAADGAARFCSRAARAARRGRGHRRRQPRHDAEHVRAAGRAPPGRGEEGGLQAVLRLGRPGRGRAAHARRQSREGARRRPARCSSPRMQGGDVYVDGAAARRRARHHHRHPGRRARRSRCARRGSPPGGRR